MKIRDIHFVESVPGQPIFEMENRDIRLPFPDGRTSAMLWLTEEEVLKSLVKQDPATRNIIIAQFAECRNLIGGERKRKVISIGNGTVD